MKTNKPLLLTLALIVLGCYSAFAQDGRFDIVLGGGYYSTPSMKPVDGGAVLNGEFEYHHKKRWSFAAGILTTQYHYRMEESSVSTLSGIPINRASELQSNFLVKYKVLAEGPVSVQVGAGAGLITMGKNTEIRTPNSSSYYWTSNTDLGFPLVAEAYVKLTNHFLVGVKLGSFIFPDYPIVGNNASFQVRYRL
ncbi:outer membrane beta-barrel protein [Persicitalea sp.]|uniref:outer membrane beta-barrel protein n=1 Tax=Persicitalea sp. TaxID=3100273 RepID=UPI0035939F4E